MDVKLQNRLSYLLQGFKDMGAVFVVDETKHIDGSKTTRYMVSFDVFEKAKVYKKKEFAPMRVHTGAVEYWNGLNIVNQNVINEEVCKAIDSAIEKHTKEGLKLAMTRYKEILDSEFFFKYKWNLPTFLKRQNAIVSFLDGGSNWESYLVWKKEKEPIKIVSRY